MLLTFDEAEDVWSRRRAGAASDSRILETPWTSTSNGPVRHARRTRAPRMVISGPASADASRPCRTLPSAAALRPGGADEPTPLRTDHHPADGDRRPPR